MKNLLGSNTGKLSYRKTQAKCNSIFTQLFYSTSFALSRS